jgi:hypothetical protein
MEFKPEWSFVESLWGFLKDVIQLVLFDSTKADLISMAGIELVENAVKYTMNNKIQNNKIVFRLDSFPEQNRVVIKVTNPALEEDIDRIKYTVTSFLSERNKKKVYLQKLREFSVIDDDNMELGLLRIIFEVGANIKVENLGENLLGIKAIFNVYRKL